MVKKRTKQSLKLQNSIYNLSNLENELDKAVDITNNSLDMWDLGSYGIKQRIQKLVFPRKNLVQIEKTILIEPMGEFGLCVELFCINSRQGEIKKGDKRTRLHFIPPGSPTLKDIEPLIQDTYNLLQLVS